MTEERINKLQADFETTLRLLDKITGVVLANSEVSRALLQKTEAEYERLGLDPVPYRQLRVKLIEEYDAFEAFIKQMLPK